MTGNRHVTSGEGTIAPSLLDYLRVLARRKLAFLLIVLLVPATAVAVSLSQPPTYQASAEVLLSARSFGGVQPTYVDPARVAQTGAELARVPAVVDQVLADVPSAGLDRTEFLESSTVSTTLGSDLLTFSVENSDPSLAMQLATEYAHAFTEYESQLEGAARTASAQVVREADQAPKVGPRTVRNGLIASCLGLVLALIIVFLVDALDTRVRSVDSIGEALRLPLLGRLAAPPSRLRKENGLVMLADPTSREAEPFRVLRASLWSALAKGCQTIMITSAVDAEGKSTTVANLAVALARAGRRVILIDADLGRPHLHRLFSLDELPGLTDLVLGDTTLEEALRPIGLTEQASELDHVSRMIHELDHMSRMMHRSGSLSVLPRGSALRDADELSFENDVGRIIQGVLARADIVLVDAPPLLMGDTIALSAHVDAVVVVVRLKALRTSTLQDMSRILEASPATKLGFILTGADKSQGYGQHQRYAGSQGRAEARPAQRADAQERAGLDAAHDTLKDA